MASLPREPNPINPIRTVSIGGQLNPITSRWPAGRSGVDTVTHCVYVSSLCVSIARNRPATIQAIANIISGMFFFMIIEFED